jgi:tetratricopeptide (TPR) repeat protein
MSEEQSRADIQLKIRELLGRATLARARGRHDEALELAREASSLGEKNWEAHELSGDIFLDLERPSDALASYRQARKLNPARGILEEKIGRAALGDRRQRRQAERSRALLEGTAEPAGPTRNPSYAALFSLIVPGLGQVYNGQVLKGAIMLVVFVFLFALASLSVLRQLTLAPPGGTGTAYGSQMDPGSIFAALFSGLAGLWVLLLAALWIYAVADAALRAARTMTSDDTGLV